MATVCEKEQCTGCMACVGICPRKAIHIEDSLNSYNAVIEEKLCVECNLCHKICPQNHPVERNTPKLWQQGWAKDESIRKSSSSGGFASAIAKAFLNTGVVCGCVFEAGRVCFKIIDRKDDLYKLSGSRYVKSNPAGIHEEIRALLKDGKKVLFIGLPCQVAGVKRYVGVALEKNLYTVDLICHGTPSPNVLDVFLKQYGYKLSDLADIRFRVKDNFQQLDGYKSFTEKGTTDTYLIAFLNGLTYTENCYSCQYAQEKRVSDLTIGDSWGSQLSAEQTKKGISLALCQTEKGKQLLKMSDLELFDVDKERAKQFNHQLEMPSSKPSKREKFFRKLVQGKDFNELVVWAYPKQCLKQLIKSVLIQLRIISELRGSITFSCRVRTKENSKV